jgi:hypothetical protein
MQLVNGRIFESDAGVGDVYIVQVGLSEMLLVVDRWTRRSFQQGPQPIRAHMSALITQKFVHHVSLLQLQCKRILSLKPARQKHHKHASKINI